MANETNNDAGSPSLLAVARVTAWASGLFSLVVATLILATYFQARARPPLDGPALTHLMTRFREQPDTAGLREEIRALDLLARKAYFTSQWQLRSGTVLLAVGVVLFIASLHVLSRGQRRLPVPAGCPGGENEWEAARRARHLLAGFGGAVLAVSVGLLLWQGLRPVLPPPVPGPEVRTPQSGAAVPVVTAIPAVSATSQPTGVQGAPASLVTRADLLRNWPGFRGPDGNGIAGTTTAPTQWDGASGKNVRWKAKFPKPGFNSPIVWDKQLFLAGADREQRQVYAFDAGCGALVWQADVKAVPGSPAEAPQVTDDTGYAASTMATDGQRVFAIFANGDLVCLDLAGKQLWAKNLGTPQNHYGHSSSLLVTEGRLIVQYDTAEAGRLVALDPQTGKNLWDVFRQVEVCWASPIAVNTGTRTEIILNANPAVTSYDPATGKEWWKAEGMGGEVAPSPAYAAGVAFAVNQYACLMAIDVKNGSVLWKNDSAALPNVASPLATAGFLFLAGSDGEVTCFEATSGKILWTHTFDKGFYASPILVGDRVYLLDMGGVMHIVTAAATFAEVGTASLGEGALCTPAVAGGRIYIRGERFLYCLE